ncbi:MAG TPA: ATP-binding cassette domain-containing protein [Bacteroidales bacterium]|nr:ATP-binding cassette domain-containing protein [Bacteroidales bacterium]
MEVSIENLSKSYGFQKAVDDISFKVDTGEIVGFLGPNGAGKTTTMKIITCALAPQAGDVKVGGVSVQQNPEEVKRHIGYLPETNPLYKEMPVIDYLHFVAEIQGVPKAKIRERILEMVNVCGLKAEKHKKIGELSKGYQQRVGLAQAMIHDPEVLILDEPTSGLDPNQIVEIRELIKKIGREKTVLLSSHILAEVEATCDRIVIINKGQLVADNTANNLRKQAQDKEIVKVTIEDGTHEEIYQALRAIESVELVDVLPRNTMAFEIQSRAGMSSRRAIFRMCADKGWTLTEMTPVERKLEEVFRDLTVTGNTAGH